MDRGVRCRVPAPNVKEYELMSKFYEIPSPLRAESFWPAASAERGRVMRRGLSHHAPVSPPCSAIPTPEVGHGGGFKNAQGRIKRHGPGILLRSREHPGQRGKIMSENEKMVKNVLIVALVKADPVLMQMWTMYLKSLEGPTRKAA